MGVFYGDKIYGVRWSKLNTDIDSYDSSTIIFELKFRPLTKTHMYMIKDAFQKLENQEIEKENQEIEKKNDIIQYYFHRIMQTTHEWCSIADEIKCYVWVKCNKEDVEKFIQQC